MKTIQGTSRQQMQFSSLDDLISGDNPVRILDAFVEKLDTKRLGLSLQTPGKQTHPGGAPPL